MSQARCILIIVKLKQNLRKIGQFRVYNESREQPDQSQVKLGGFRNPKFCWKKKNRLTLRVYLRFYLAKVINT